MKKIISLVLVMVIVLAFTGCVKKEAEVYTYHGKTYAADELSQETKDWLKFYNQLTEEEQNCINHVPYELREDALSEVMETNEAD